MKITPVSFNFRKFYDFEHNDPRKNHPNFKLGMPDKDVVEVVSEGDNYSYPVTAEQLRAIYIRQQGYDFETHYPDNQVVAKRKDDGSNCTYDVTAGHLREEIIEEENKQKEYEKTSLSDDILSRVSGGYSDIPSWDRYPY